MLAHKATIVVDLGFGDSGKGSIVDYLTRGAKTPTIVRFNGGAQAAHNVVTPEGKHHTFAQFGAGSFLSGVRTHLSRFMLVDPSAMQKEAAHLQSLGLGNLFARLSVDEQALVVTPFHKAGNRLRESLRGGARHGSTGMGIGETMADSIAFPQSAIVAADLRNPEALERKLEILQDRKYEEFKGSLRILEQDPHVAGEIELLRDSRAPRVWALHLWQFGMRMRIVLGKYLERLAHEGDLIFEGAQGVLLDEWHGFHPYTTWSTTTFYNALTLLREIGYSEPVEKLGVLRAYMTRHGPGPFPTEDKVLGQLIPDYHNGAGEWQGAFRIGWLDLVLAKYALAVSGGADTLAITNIDRLKNISARVSKSYLLPQEKGGQVVFELKPKTILTDLSQQEVLTKLLNTVSPMYVDVQPGSDAFIQLIEKELRVPVTIISHGPTALDKKTRSILELAA